MDNVIQFPGSEPNEATPEEVLTASLAAGLEEVVVIGWARTEDPDDGLVLYLSTSHESAKSMLLLNLAEHDLVREFFSD